MLIKLRGHHLGIIYNKIKYSQKKDTVCNYEKDMTRALKKLDYPHETIKKSLKILRSIFFPSQDTLIEIVAGPDDICLAGCLEKHKKDIEFKKKSDFDLTFIRYELKSTCQNKNFQEDADMLKIFGFRLGDIISGEKIYTIACQLAETYQAESWPDLLEEYYALPKEEVS